MHFAFALISQFQKLDVQMVLLQVKSVNSEDFKTNAITRAINLSISFQLANLFKGRDFIFESCQVIFFYNLSQFTKN